MASGSGMRGRYTGPSNGAYCFGLFITLVALTALALSIGNAVHNDKHHHDDDDGADDAARAIKAPAKATGTNNKLLAGRSLVFGPVVTQWPLASGVFDFVPPATVPPGNPNTDTAIDLEPYAGTPKDDTSNGAKYGSIQSASINGTVTSAPALSVLGASSTCMYRCDVPTWIVPTLVTEPVVAVGGTYNVIVGNDGVRVIDKASGALTAYAAKHVFWGQLVNGSTLEGRMHYTYDPRAYYDSDAGRYVIVMAGAPYCLFGTNKQFTQGIMLLAVSASSDPFGAWHMYRHYVTPDNNNGRQENKFVDFPMLAVTKRDIVITFFEYGQSSGSLNTVYQIRKQHAYAATPSLPFLRYSSMQAASSPVRDDFFAAPTPYLVEQDSRDSTKLNQVVTVWRLRDDGVAETLGAFKNPDATASAGRYLPQLGTTYRLVPVLSISSEPRYVNGMVYIAMAAADPVTKQSFFYVTRFNPLTFAAAAEPPVFVRIRNADPSVHYAYPAISVSPDGDIVVVFSVFTPHTYASSAYTVWRAGSPDITAYETPIVFAIGTGIQTTTPRWGDYLDVAYDTFTGAGADKFWLLGMFSEGTMITCLNETRNMQMSQLTSIALI